MPSVGTWFESMHLEWWSESQWYGVDPKEEGHLNRIERCDGDSVRESNGGVMVMLLD